MIISFSSAKTWRECRQKWDYRYRQKLKRRGPKSGRMYRGTIIHELLEAHLKRTRPIPTGPTFVEVVMKYQGEYDALMLEERMELGPNFIDECVGIACGWIDYWPQQETVAVEVEFGETEPCEVYPGLFVRGRIDWLFRDSRGLWVGEHKTIWGKPPSDDFRIVDMQTALYIRVAEVLQFGTPVGSCHDYLRTKPPGVPALLKSGLALSKAKIDTDEATFRREIERYGFDPADYREQLSRCSPRYERRFLPRSQVAVDSMLRELRDQAGEMGELAVYRNPSRDCDRCEYKDLCRAELLGLDDEWVRKSQYEVKKKIEETPEPEEETVEAN